MYTEILHRFRHRHRWMAFFDADEFLVLRDPSVPDLPALLVDYEQHGALAVNWLGFSSSGHVARPNGSVLSSYLECFVKAPFRSKMVVNTKYGLYAESPHVFRLW